MQKSKHKGFFITFEGPDGSGKSTHAALLKEYLEKKGYSVLHTREPGGTGAAEAIRRILLHPASTIAPLTELLLYEASRAQHTEEIIKPALAQGKLVISERYTDATLAYQGYGRKMDLKLIGTLNKIATQGLVPDLTVCLDIPAKIGLAKAKAADKPFEQGDRLEREPAWFHARVRRGYGALQKKEPKRIQMVKTGKSVNETHRTIVQIVEERL